MRKDEMFSAAPILAQLKDFQRGAVEHAYQRLYVDTDATRRFLIADEVGLGKTMIAKGLIAKVVETLQHTVRRLDVIYVCSNADIATQNVARLNVSGEQAFAKATRLTLLPLEVHELEKQSLNFVSFTPGTTFDMGNRTGHKAERRLLYQMLTYRRRERFCRGLQNLLQSPVRSHDTWVAYTADWQTFDPTIARDFRDAVWSQPDLAREILALTARYYDRRRAIPSDINERRLALLARLRKTLAKRCLNALQPDLIILDEFQRFRELMDPKNPAAELATDLFSYRHDAKVGDPAPRVVLLSATPYKMYTRDEDDEDHYADFRATLGFLANGQQHRLTAIEQDLARMRDGMVSISNDAGFHAARDRLQDNLLKLMCRNERVARTQRADAMVSEWRKPARLTSQDLGQLQALTRIGETFGHRDLVEYWKSSPYLLNFMKGYQFKERFDAARASTETQTLVDLHRDHLLSIAKIQRFESIDPGNPKLRALIEEMDDNGLWRLLWLPPSLAYWRPAGPYSDVPSVSKELIFSSWNVVPDAIAAMMSYAAHAQVFAGYDRISEYSELGTVPRRLNYARRETRPASMNVFSLFCPSPTLVSLIDPAELALQNDHATPDLDQVLAHVAEHVRPLIETLPPPSAPMPDSPPYWRLVAYLAGQDTGTDYLNWCRDGMLASSESEEDDSAVLVEHAQFFASEAESDSHTRVGSDNADIETLSRLALGAPANCALRALHRLDPMMSWTSRALLDAAAIVGEGLRSLFNAPDNTALLHLDEHAGEAYWQRVLRYCLDGNLQSMLDEHVHVLSESLGGRDQPAEKRVLRIAAEIRDALSLRMTRIQADTLDEADPTLNIRCRYAMRFGETTDEESGKTNRKELVRIAFNSPFRPFVLASTSVGQEGLDFHQWCHSIVHWNLPSNPVDMEQREGRVHRYKGYAVRKNVARSALSDVDGVTTKPFSDPWKALFAHALACRPAGAGDMIPYWIYETEGGDSVRRRILNPPLSIDETRYERLQKNLALYRMAFGQPRQEDLLRHLESRFTLEEAQDLASRWQISLSPTLQSES
ncbi:helicase domain-containing protein [Salinisphaera dokdonensis CL-ES53]|uniref:Helicase domain-containing protein n=1 Tax=Salinisphaera dokdonensis CL-ES53 TaxID=1304272 RepID=A0ABV2AYZ9_9GAMM